MTNEEFEEIFGNVPFKDIKKIQKYIQEKIENKDREIEKLEKQSKSIDRQAQQYFEQTIYLNKIIDLMARAFKQDDIRTVEEIKQYFESKAKE